MAKQMMTGRRAGFVLGAAMVVGIAGLGWSNSTNRSDIASDVEAVYLWSPTMPLSEIDRDAVEEAAAELDLPVRVIQAEELSSLASPPLVESLVMAGATVHYPTVTLIRKGRVEGPSMAGFKTKAAWKSLLSERLASVASFVSAPAPTPVEAEEADLEIVWRHTVSPTPGAFFRRVPGTSLIGYDQSRRVFLRDVTDGSQFQGPGWIDFVPSPDGRLFVTPADNNEGLEFYDADEVLRRGAAGSAATVSPRYVDPALNDQYPSVGILEADEDGRRTRYRIVVSWFRGVAFRDYEVRWDESGVPSVEALTVKRPACEGLDLSTPILSKDGREIAGRHGGTTRIFHLYDDGRCDEVQDLGVLTSKVGFSDDGTRVAYSSPIAGSSESRTWVLDRPTNRTMAVPQSRSAGLVIPEFVGPDSLLISVREARGRASEFRLLCCVR